MCGRRENLMRSRIARCEFEVSKKVQAHYFGVYATVEEGPRNSCPGTLGAQTALPSTLINDDDACAYDAFNKPEIIYE